jgi:hypothetical protein
MRKSDQPAQTRPFMKTGAPQREAWARRTGSLADHYYADADVLQPAAPSV